MSEFYKWWDETGSGLIPADGKDHEEHACAIALLAWDAARKALERQLAEVRGELEQCNQRVKDYQSDVADLEGANESLSDLRQSAEGERDAAIYKLNIEHTNCRRFQESYAEKRNHEVRVARETAIWECAAECLITAKRSIDSVGARNCLEIREAILALLPLPASDVDKPEGDTNA